jgi:hypothetical protein
MYALVTTHRGVIMSVTVGPSVGDLKAVVRDRLGAPVGPVRWTNYLSHEGITTGDGLTTHSIHRAEGEAEGEFLRECEHECEVTREDLDDLRRGIEDSLTLLSERIDGMVD